MLNFLISYWWIVILIIALISIIGYFLYTFITMPSTTQITKVKEWLLYAVAIAEKELGSGTGQIKLRYVYDMFIVKFPHLAEKISFESFKLLVDKALEKFEHLLNSNDKLQTYIKG